MKLFTTYFYKIRFMKPYQIPISTAIWDPKWYHEFKDSNHKFLDNNGVINGLRLECLHPGHQLDGTCHGRPCNYDHRTCEFLKGYRKQIFNLDKSVVLSDLEKIAEIIKKRLQFTEEPEVMLIVHEDSNNPCSERVVLQEFFGCIEWDNGVE